MSARFVGNAEEGEEKMKCPRCASDMKRHKLKEHQFMYICPKCKFKIGTKNDDEKSTSIIDTDADSKQ